jgi:hypothetical protein
VAIITTFALMFLSINYGNTLRWQMRAQNAADAAAQALMSIQTERFNEVTATLYTANVEEFRIRLLLDGMLNALNGGGGCGGLPSSQRASGQPLFTTGTGTCDQVFANLLPIYEEAVARYGTDVALLNNVATLETYSNWKSDSLSLLTHLHAAAHCNTISTTTVLPDGGDCQFQYTLNGIAYRTGLNAVSADAYVVFLPTQGFAMTNNAETENPQFFDPGMVDVVTCAKVPPIIPIFSALQAKTQYVIGRAGATAIMAENEWLQPGYITDPARPGSWISFQPYENYTSADSTLGYDWYGVLFGGNAWQIGTFADPVIPGKTDYDYTAHPTVNEFDAYLGWWAAIPYDPRLVVPGAAPPVTASVCPP